MKHIIEKDDIVQGAEFIMPLQTATGQFNQLTIMNHLGRLVVANRCIPPWLHEAQQAEQARLAREAE